MISNQSENKESVKSHVSRVVTNLTLKSYPPTGLLQKVAHQGVQNEQSKDAPGATSRKKSYRPKSKMAAKHVIWSG